MSLCTPTRFWLASALAVVLSTGILARHFNNPAQVAASDHIDSPSIAQYRGADISDLWAFLDPNDNSKVVLVMSTQGFVVSSEHFGEAIFDHNLRYRFEIENTGDAIPDGFVDVYYSKGLGRQTPQTARIVLPNGQSFTAPTTIATQEYTAPAPVITTDPATGVSFFGGVADDPFFLDDTGANRLVASAMQNPGNPDKSLLSERGGRDTYAGFNSMLTVVSIPRAYLKGASNIIGINAVTQRQRDQSIRDDGSIASSGPWINIDRDGNPLVVNGLIPPDRKNEYNNATTDADARGRFRASLLQSMQSFGTDAAHAEMLLKIIQENGDILRLDLSVPNTGPGGGNNSDGGFGHMGGRRLQDDVVDATFTMLNNGVTLSDLVNGNQVPFRNAFPFVADPIQPFHAGVIDDQTRQ